MEKALFHATAAKARMALCKERGACYNVPYDRAKEVKAAMDYQTTAGSRDVARAAIELSMTQSRDEEQRWRQTLRQQGVIGAAADFGGDFLTGIVRIVERAVVAAKREQVIGDSHLEEGGVAGAAREALNQVTPKALGMSVGGKIGIARSGEHVAVAVFFNIGLGHLDEVCIGLGHRAI